MKHLIPILMLTLLPSICWAQARRAQPDAPVPLEKQTVCEASVFFTWKRILEPKSIINAKGESELIAPDPALLEPIEVFHTRVGETGASEGQVRARLIKRLDEVQGQARARCAAQHENQSACIKSRIDGLGSNYLTFDFQARKALLDSINEDCKNIRGVCLSTRTSEIRCAINTPPSLRMMEEEKAVLDEKAEPAMEEEKPAE